MWEMAAACNMVCYIRVFLNAVIEQSSSLWLIIRVKEAKLSTKSCSALLSLSKHEHPI